MTQHTAQLHQSQLDYATVGARLRQGRDAAEAEILAAILADPCRGFADARAAGLHSQHLAESDPLHLMTWLATGVAIRRGYLKGDLRTDQRFIFRLVREQLVSTGEWDNHRHPETLADWAYSHFAYFSAAVVNAVKLLLEKVERSIELRRIFARASVLMEGA